MSFFLVLQNPSKAMPLSRECLRRQVVGYLSIVFGVATSLSMIGTVRSQMFVTEDTTQNGGSFVLTPAQPLVISHDTNNPLFSLTGSASTDGVSAVVVGSLTGEQGHLFVHDHSTLLNPGYPNTPTITLGNETIASGNYIGLNAGSVGTAIVSGAGAQWWSSPNAQGFFVGHSGSGQLTIENGGRAFGSYAMGIVTGIGSLGGVVGYNPGSEGKVTVTGLGSQFGSDLSVGHAGAGELLIENGATVSGPSGSNIGFAPGSQGKAIVTGNSVWSPSALFVGRSGSGELLITDGGRVNTEGSVDYGAFNAVVGQESGSHGMVTISGPGSEWSIASGETHIGHHGTGIVEIENGGSLTARRLYVGSGSQGFGAVHVSGNGSRATPSYGGFIGGNGGVGEVVISGGGAVLPEFTFPSAFDVGTGSGSSGSVTIQGEGSRWTQQGEFRIGNHGGTGEVLVQDGGALQVVLGGAIGVHGGIGHATVRNATWTNVSFLSVGQSGIGELIVDNSANVSSAAGYIGYADGSNGTVVVSGPESTWTNTEGIYQIPGRGDIVLAGTSVADSTLATGLLRVEDGGRVIVGGVLKLHRGGALTGDGGTIEGNVVNNGLVAPGDGPALFTIEGNYTQEVDGLFEVDLAGLLAGVQYDQLAVTGDVSLAGLLNVHYHDDFVLSADQWFDILTVGGTLSGGFTGLDDGGLVDTFGDVNLFIDYHKGGVRLYTSVVPEPSSLFLVGVTAMAGCIRRRRRTTQSWGKRV